MNCNNINHSNESLKVRDIQIDGYPTEKAKENKVHDMVAKIENMPGSSEKNGQAAKKIQSKFIALSENHAFEKIENKRYQEVADQYGGYDTLILQGHEYVVPKKPEQVLSAYKELKTKISSKIVVDESIEHVKDAKKWENTAMTISELMKDAAIIKDEYAIFIKKLAEKNNGKACFGHNNQFILKSKHSIERKVKDDIKELDKAESEVVSKIADSIRGSIVVATPQDITHVVKELQSSAKEKGWDITFKNIWQEDRANGYVGVHAKLKLITPEGRIVIAELQIHLPEIYNGTEKCIKEHNHKIFEYARIAYGPEKQGQKPQPPSFAKKISILQYLSHLKNIET